MRWSPSTPAVSREAPRVVLVGIPLHRLSRHHQLPCLAILVPWFLQIWSLVSGCLGGCLVRCWSVGVGFTLYLRFAETTLGAGQQHSGGCSARACALCPWLSLHRWVWSWDLGRIFLRFWRKGGYHLDHFLGVDGFFFFPLFFFNKIITNSFHATISKYRLQRWHKC